MQPVDKPPLLFYGQAFFYLLSGPVEWAARWPNFIAAILLVPLVGLTAWQLYQDAAASVAAAFFVAVSPLAVQFSATAFTDPLLVTFLVAALWLSAPKTHPGQAGFFFGLGVMTKYQAWLFWPLLLAAAWRGGWRWPEWRRWLQGVVPVLLVLVAWEVARSGHFSLWSAQIRNYGGSRLIWSWELWPRLVGWAGLWRLLLGSAVGGGLFVVLVGVLWWQGNQIDRWLIGYIAMYMAGHWLLAVPVWDRYLLPLLPLVGLLVGRGVMWVRQHSWPRAALVGGAVLLAAVFYSMAGTVRAAQEGRWPIGGQPAADQGAAQVAHFLEAAPYGTVLYDHWFSWQWRYHLFDKKVFVSWFPHPEALVQDLQVFGHKAQPRYLVGPQTAGLKPVQRAVAEAGFQLQFVFADEQNRMALYRILPLE